jgi:Flagellar hook-length control protein FliK
LLLPLTMELAGLPEGTASPAAAAAVPVPHPPPAAAVSETPAAADGDRDASFRAALAALATGPGKTPAHVAARTATGGGEASAGGQPRADRSSSQAGVDGTLATLAAATLGATAAVAPGDERVAAAASRTEAAVVEAGAATVSGASSAGAAPAGAHAATPGDAPVRAGGSGTTAAVVVGGAQGPSSETAPDVVAPASVASGGEKAASAASVAGNEAGVADAEARVAGEEAGIVEAEPGVAREDVRAPAERVQGTAVPSDRRGQTTASSADAPATPAHDAAPALEREPGEPQHRSGVPVPAGGNHGDAPADADGRVAEGGGVDTVRPHARPTGGGEAAVADRVLGRAAGGGESDAHGTASGDGRGAHRHPGAGGDAAAGAVRLRAESGDGAPVHEADQDPSSRRGAFHGGVRVADGVGAAATRPVASADPGGIAGPADSSDGGPRVDAPAAAVDAAPPAAAGAREGLDALTRTLRGDRPEGFAQLAERVVDALHLSAARGGSEIRLRLEPPGLGHIDVRIDVRHDDVRAVIVTEHDSTRTLLASQQHVLQAALARSDLRLSGFSVDVGLGQGSGAFGQEPGREGFVLPGPPAEPVTTGGAPAVSHGMSPDAVAPGRLSLRV